MKRFVQKETESSTHGKDEYLTTIHWVEVASSGCTYQAAKRQGKYPPLATDTEVNTCFSIY